MERPKRSKLVAKRRARGYSQESLAHKLGVDRTTVGRWERDETEPEPWNRQPLADLLAVSLDALDDLLVVDDAQDSDWTTVAPPSLDDIEALELVRRIEASDTGPATLEGLEMATDRMSRSYTSTPPGELLAPLRAYRGYVTQLLDGRATLAQRRELMVVGGWLSLLIAICNIDLQRYQAAAINLHAARSLAAEAGYPLLTGWVLETEAWQAITQGQPDRAVPLCEAGLERVAPDTSLHVQLSMQQARASARLGLTRDTRRLLDQAETSLGRMPTPEHPEHHFTFDPRKLVSYTATTLAWLGDDLDLAEEYARAAVEQYDTGAADGRWRSRLASARLDLAMVLAQRDGPAEAAHLGTLALNSGALRRSNLWRAVELDRSLTGRYDGVVEVAEFHEQVVVHELPPPRAELTAHPTGEQGGNP